MSDRVKTLVESDQIFATMYVPMNHLPIIHPPIVLPAPEPGSYKEIERWGSLAWYTRVFKEHSRKEAMRFAWNTLKVTTKHKWFLFKMTHGVTRDERSWLFKQ